MGLLNQIRRGTAASQLPFGLLLLAPLVVSLTACQIIENLTEPATGVMQRTIELSMTPTSLPEGGGDVEVEALVLVADVVESEILVTFSAAAGEFPNGNTATTDAEGKARVTLRTTSTTEVTAAILAAGITLTESAAGRLEVGDEVLPTGKVKFEVEFSPRPAELDKPVQIKVIATNEDGSGAEGALKVEFGDGKSTRIADFKRRATVEHSYREASFFNVVTSLFTGGGEVSSKTLSLRVNDTTETGIVLSAAALETYAREPLRFNIELDNGQRAQASGDVTVDWGDGRSTNVGQVTGSTAVEHTFRDAGSYRVVASVVNPNGKVGRSDLRVRVDPRLTADLGLTADVALVGEPTVFMVTASLSNGAAPNGTATIQYGDGTSDTGPLTGGSAEVAHTYLTEGTYTARVNFEDDAGRTATASLNVLIKTEDQGGGGGDDGGGGGGGDDGGGGGGGDDGGGGGDDGGGGGGGGPDELNLSQVVFLNHNISGWPITSTLTGVSISAGQICMPHTKAGKWPVAIEPGGGVAVEGNPWIIANVNGTWYAAIFEWFVPGGTCKGMGAKPPSSTIATQMKSHVKFSPLNSWTPKSGEVVYIFVSALAWPGHTPVLAKERSQARRVVWP